MIRRQGRRNARQSTVRSPFAAALSALAGGSVFTASRYTAAGAKVGAYVDWLDPAHTLAQAVDANRVLAPTADAALRGAMSASHADGNVYTSNRAPATWKRLHDGSGGGARLLWVPETVPASTSNCYLLQTSDESVNGGMLMNAVYLTSPANRYALYFTNDAGTPFVSQSYSTDAFAAGVGADWHYSFATADNPDAAQFIAGESVATGDASEAPFSGDPLSSLKLCGTTVQAGWTWRFHALFVPPAAWTAAQVAAVSRYAQTLGLAGA